MNPARTSTAMDNMSAAISLTRGFACGRRRDTCVIVTLLIAAGNGHSRSIGFGQIHQPMPHM
jgi:hypothetical protein